MSRQANPAAVGGFVVGALALAVGGVLFFGGGKFFAETTKAVIFFDGSVNGLQVGSKVKLQGVEIGEVLSVHAIADVGQGEILTETVIEIDRSRFERRGPSIADPRQRHQALIDMGLRARLELQSLITGQLYVGLDVLPNTEPRLVGGETQYPELPAVPTKSQEIQRAAEKVVEKLRDLPVEDIVERLKSIAGGVDRLVNDSELDETIANLNRTLEETRGAVVDARRLVRNVDERVTPVSESAVAALGQATETLESFDHLVEPGSSTTYQISLALQELTEAARAIRLLAAYLEENPNSVVFGRASGGD